MKYFKKSDQILTFADLLTIPMKNNNQEEFDYLSLGCLLQKMPGCKEEYLSNVFQAVLQSKEWTSIKTNKTSK